MNATPTASEKKSSPGHSQQLDLKTALMLTQSYRGTRGLVGDSGCFGTLAMMCHSLAQLVSNMEVI